MIAGARSAWKDILAGIEQKWQNWAQYCTATITVRRTLPSLNAPAISTPETPVFGASAVRIFMPGSRLLLGIARYNTAKNTSDVARDNDNKCEKARDHAPSEAGKVGDGWHDLFESPVQENTRLAAATPLCSAS